MNGYLKTLTRIGVSALALALFAGVPSAADAGSVGFRNDTKSRIIVQGQTIVNGMIRKGPLLVIDPGKTAWDLNVPPGPRTITICDGFQTTRILFRETVPMGVNNVLFSVQPLPPNRLRLLTVPLPGP
jgi:hypothetical protein